MSIQTQSSADLRAHADRLIDAAVDVATQQLANECEARDIAAGMNETARTVARILDEADVLELREPSNLDLVGELLWGTACKSVSADDPARLCYLSVRHPSTMDHLYAVPATTLTAALTAVPA